MGRDELEACARLHVGALDGSQVPVVVRCVMTVLGQGSFHSKPSGLFSIDACVREAGREEYALQSYCTPGLGSRRHAVPTPRWWPRRWPRRSWADSTARLRAVEPRQSHRASSLQLAVLTGSFRLKAVVSLESHEANPWKTSRNLSDASLVLISAMIDSGVSTILARKAAC